MSRIVKILLSMCAAVFVSQAAAQETQKVKGPDERYKVDILVIVAHPDDEGAVTPYLAKAIYDLHKTVGVVFGTRGGSGGNDYRREHGPAMADVREIEARQACAKLGIDKVWFLGGKDTASQNVLNSLANWGHGASLEELVRIVRLTRPEVIITWLPSIFIGENHGDHQAAGVLATEAFDAAADPTVFPAQLAGASKRLEPYLENLTPWQPKKIYYFSDANNQKQFAGKGFAYSVREISPSQKKPYWLLAMRSAESHLTQFPDDINRWANLNDEEIQKAMSDPSKLWWSDPETLIFGKSAVAAKPTDDVFAGIDDSAAMRIQPSPFDNGSHANQLRVGGPWAFYAEFRKKHQLDDLPVADPPEIMVKSGTTLMIPLIVEHSSTRATTVKIDVAAPQGWRVESGEGRFQLPLEKMTALQVDVAIPSISREEAGAAKPQTIAVRAEIDGKPIGEVKLKVALQNGGVPQ
ncbi:MAG: PIG-L family deacetylase [Acidobacteria bacterium]|nr:PIG-L family deacetylase [Acidobacteriota bacterium]MBS1864342.1 PIG-L family deacetylase [Acidobacteriota bacterium]